MTKIAVESKLEFQKGLERRLAKREKGGAIKRFARQFFSQVPLTEVRTKDWEYAEAVLYSNWVFFKSFNGKTARVRVVNPIKKTHGYDHHQTVIEVASRNLPFLLDSIRIELANHGIGLSDVQQCLLSVVRGKNNRISIDENEQATETLIHLEVDRPNNNKALEKDIRKVLRLVQCIVDDFAAMRRQLLFWRDEFGVVNQQTGDVHEAYGAMQWIYANNFTFLGYEEFKKTPEYENILKKWGLGL